MTDFVIDQTTIRTISAGSEMKVAARGTFGTYETNGCLFNLNVIGLSRVTRVKFQPEQGYTFEYDYTTNRIKVRYEGNAAVSLTFTGTPLNSVTNQVVDNINPPAAGELAYIGYDKQNGNGYFGYENPNDFKPQWIKADYTSNFYIKNLPIRSRTYKIRYDADPVVNLGAFAVNVRVTGKYGEGYSGKLVANTGNPVSEFTDTGTGSNTFQVIGDTGYNQDSFGLYYNETLAAGSRLVTNAPGDVYIFSTTGAILRIGADGSAGIGPNYKQVYLDDNAVNPDERLFAVLDALANTTETQDGVEIANETELTRFFDLYFNANAAQEDRLQANMTTIQEDIYVPVGNNRAQKVVYNVNAAIDGVRVYYDSNIDNKFIAQLGVSSLVALSQTTQPFGQVATGSVSGITSSVASEVANGVDLSVLNSIEFEAYGFY